MKKKDIRARYIRVLERTDINELRDFDGFRELERIVFGILQERRPRKGAGE